MGEETQGGNTGGELRDDALPLCPWCGQILPDNEWPNVHRMAFCVDAKQAIFTHARRMGAAILKRTTELTDEEIARTVEEELTARTTQGLLWLSLSSTQRSVVVMAGLLQAYTLMAQTLTKGEKEIVTGLLGEKAPRVIEAMLTVRRQFIKTHSGIADLLTAGEADTAGFMTSEKVH